MLGTPYWYGTFGQIATESLLNQKKAQYPTYYSNKDYTVEYGKTVHDCVGLIKAYLWKDDGKLTYVPEQDKSADGIKSYCSDKGSINTIPEIKGILVFMPNHVGVYIGDGYVIEDKGSTGVIKTKLKERPWIEWGKLDWIEYVEENLTEEEQMKYIQEKCGYDDNTMFWLSRYLYHKPLFKKWYDSYKK